VKIGRAARLASCGALAVLLAAGCGGSGSGSKLDAACSRQAALLAQVREPKDLVTAAQALVSVVRVDRDMTAALGGKPDLAARARGAAARAGRTLSDIRQTDQQAMMSPLRTGVPGTRRAIAESRALLRASCPSRD
jgi:hypothetical protein